MSSSGTCISTSGTLRFFFFLGFFFFPQPSPVSKHPTIGMLPPRKSFCITRPCITPAQRAQGLASPLQLAGDNLRGTPHVLLIHIRNEQYTASWMSSTLLLGARVDKGK